MEEGRRFKTIVVKLLLILVGKSFDYPFTEEGVSPVIKDALDFVAEMED